MLNFVNCVSIANLASWVIVRVGKLCELGDSDEFQGISGATYVQLLEQALVTSLG